MNVLFWCSTLVPGLALARLWFPRHCRYGFLGTLAWAFVLTSCVLTPLTIVAFAAGLSARTAALGYLLIVAAALPLLLWRLPPWSSHRHLRVVLASRPMWVALGVVAATLVLPGSARFDAEMHAAKIVEIQQVGFTLQDPHSPLAVINSAFHVNVLHLLHAAGSWLTGEPPLEFWYGSAWFFRLLCFGGVELLALRVFRRRWLAGLAVLGSAGMLGLIPDNALPSVITSYIVLPLLLAQLWDVLARPSAGAYGTLALTGTALGVMHVGHWGIFLLAIAPVVAGWATWRLYQGRPWMHGAGALFATFLPGVPFFLISILQPDYGMVAMSQELRWELSTNRVFGITIQNLSVTSSLWIFPTAAMTALLIVLMRRRRFPLAFLGAMFAVGVNCMYNPAVFAVVSRIVPFWMLRRLMALAVLLAALTLVAGVGWLARETLRRERQRLAFSLVVLVAGLVLYSENIAARFARVAADREALARAAEIRALLEGVPGRPLIAADRELSLLIPSARPAAVMAQSFGNLNPADPGLLERAAAADELLAPGTSPARRDALADRYDIDYAITRGADRRLHLTVLDPDP